MFGLKHHYIQYQTEVDEHPNNLQVQEPRWSLHVFLLLGLLFLHTKTEEGKSAKNNVNILQL